MSKPTSKKQLALRTLWLLFGSALLACLVRQIGCREIVEEISRVGRGLILILALGGVSYLVRTWAWRLTLAGWKENVSFLRMLRLRLASEAVGQVGALGQLFGEGVRISALSPKVPIEIRILSVTLDRALFVVSGAMVTLAGLLAAPLVLSLTHALRLYSIFFAATLICLLFVVALALFRRWPLLSTSVRALSRMRWLSDKVEGALAIIYLVENKLFDFYNDKPGMFWGSLALNLTSHGIAVFEVYLVLWLLGVKIGCLSAVVFEALTKLVNVVGTVNPGNIGTYEGGNVLIARMFGLNGAIGLAIALTRRVRAIFWAFVGVPFLLPLFRFGDYSDPDSARSGDVAKGPESGREGPGINQTLTVVILATPRQGFRKAASHHFQVGALPILLRNILTAEKVGARRIIVCVDPVGKPNLQRELLGTGRLPHFVEWFDAGSGTPLRQLLTHIATEPGDGYLLLVAGNTTYHPALFQRASEWSGRCGALAMTSGDQLVGIYVLDADTLFNVAVRCPFQVQTIEELHVWLILNDSVQYEPVRDGLWQRVRSPEDCLAAERKLDQWLVKTTDGIFARMNRRISVPISRQIIRLPITPNMVSLFTLGVGFTAGLFYARGGYWNMLVGAGLSVCASIFDGCDGEVARLKLLESKLGCWLETICDYLYYLLIFAGMAIGLMRTSGNRMYLAWGSLLLIGAILSFLITGLGRHRLATRRPEQYLEIWQAKAEHWRSNPILYLGRYTEFIIRRCFLPYALLLFAVFNVTAVAFFLASIGANLVWLVSLYSLYTFALVRRSHIADSCASARHSALTRPNTG